MRAEQRRANLFAVALALGAGAIGMLALGGCNTSVAESDEMAIEDLEGRWELVAVDEEPVPSGSAPYFELAGDRISGFDGCNKFAGSLSAPGTIRQGQRGCSDDTLSLPLSLADPAPQLARARLEGDRLIVPLEDEETTAVFQRSTP